MGFLKRPSPKTAGKLLNLGRNKPQTMMGLLRGHCYLTRYMYKLGLEKNNECDRCKQASDMALHVVCDVRLVALRYRNLGQKFMKPGDQEEISVSWMLHCVQGVAAAKCMNIQVYGLHKGSSMVKEHGSLLCVPFLYSVLLYLS
jgi:hypothetical protein